jgi:hypothetical protein
MIELLKVIAFSPGFPVEPGGVGYFMRSRQTGTAHAVVSSAPYRKSGSPEFSVELGGVG